MKNQNRVRKGNKLKNIVNVVEERNPNPFSIITISSNNIILFFRLYIIFPTYYSQIITFDNEIIKKYKLNRYG